MIPEENEIWQHYKGDEDNIVLSSLYYSDNGKYMVAYQNVDIKKDPTIYTHFIENFTTIIEHKGKFIPRFVKVKENG